MLLGYFELKSIWKDTEKIYPLSIKTYFSGVNVQRQSRDSKKRGRQNLTPCNY
jgi:hypothetical protein